MKRVILIPAVLAFTGLATPVLADWGSVAVNAATGTYGYSVRWQSKSEAGTKALAFCREFSNGADGCDLILTTTQCAGIVRGFQNFAPAFFVAENAARAAAAEDALAQCSDQLGNTCQLERSFCANDNQRN